MSCVEASDRATNTISLAPRHLLCLRCMNGGACPSFAEKFKLREKLAHIHDNPLTHVRLDCAFDEIGARGEEFYQTTPEERLMDLRVLQKLGLAPGDVRTADTLYTWLEAAIPENRALCADAGEGWTPCAYADSPCYRDGAALLRRVRPEPDCAKAKADSAAHIAEADAITVRAHHLLCMTCFAGGEEPEKPIDEDNLYEVLEKMIRNPDIPVTLVEGCSSCMICPPCHAFDPATGHCVTSCGLRDRKKDLDTFRLLGMRPGDTVPARRLLRLLYERIPDTFVVCDNGEPTTAPEWSSCERSHVYARYARGREWVLARIS